MRISRKVRLAPYVWFRVGGPAEYFARAVKADYQQALQFCARKGLDLLVLGEGSNMLIADNGFKGLVLRVAGRQTRHTIYETWREAFCAQATFSRRPRLACDALDGKASVTVPADMNLQELVAWSLNAGLVGIEWAAGLPGTVGAAVRGNVGAFGHEFAASVRSARIMRIAGSQVVEGSLERRELKFGYRGSIVKSLGYFVTEAVLELAYGDATGLRAARETACACVTYRVTRHPLEYPNCGSIFKNLVPSDEAGRRAIESVLSQFPDLESSVRSRWYGKVPAAILIERAGLRGEKCGGAQVSEKHANFIINRGRARAADIKVLIQRVENAVFKKFGVRLEPEIELVGFE